MKIYIPQDSDFYYHIEADRLIKTHYKLIRNLSRANYVYTGTIAEILEQNLLNKIQIEMTNGWKILKGVVDEAEL